MKKILLSLFILTLLIVPATTLAAKADAPTFDYDVTGGTQNVLSTETGLGEQAPTTVAIYIVNVALSILGLFFLFLMLYSGFIWMNARGREDEVTKAKNILISAIIGLVIILASYGISGFVYNAIQETTETGFLSIPAAHAAYEPQDLDFEVGEEEIAEGTQLGTQNPALVAAYIINVVLTILGLFFLFLMIYGGFIWMNARGREDEVTKSKNLIVSAIIGLIIMLASYGIVNYIFSVLYNITLVG